MALMELCHEFPNVQEKFANKALKEIFRLYNGKLKIPENGAVTARACMCNLSRALATYYITVITQAYYTQYAKYSEYMERRDVWVHPTPKPKRTDQDEIFAIDYVGKPDRFGISWFGMVHNQAKYALVSVLII